MDSLAESGHSHEANNGESGGEVTVEEERYLGAFELTILYCQLCS